MLRRVRVEGVRGQVLPWCQQPEPFSRNYPMNISFFGADRAVAFGYAAVDRPFNFVTDAAAMASAAIDWALCRFIRHEDESDANCQIQQTRHLTRRQNLSYKIRHGSQRQPR